MRLGELSAVGRHLEIAVKALRECFKLAPRRLDPTNLAGTQNNVGSALLALGEREVDPARLREAIAA